MSRLVLAALLLACSPPASLTRDMPDDWSSALAGCESLTGEARDWCALSAVTTTGGSGQKLYALCERLVTRDGYDRCVELSMRHPVSPPDMKVCSRVRERTVRESCFAQGARQDFLLDIDSAMAGCKSAGSMRESCLVMMVAARGPIWAGMGPNVMASELGFVMVQHPGLGQNTDFGNAVGEAVRNLGRAGTALDLCTTLPAGSARLACESTSQVTMGSY